ncbi:MAG: hypothetical protein ACI8UO_005828 [Verrucomicrobiales bacterium]|jgi:hypothetical protein
MSDQKTDPIGLTTNDKNSAPKSGGGPKTAGGKQRSSLNAMKFGLFAKRTVLASEDPAEFESFRSWLLGDLQPQTPMQECLAEEIVSHLWRLQRTHLAEKQIIDRYAQAINGENQGIGFAVIADAQEDSILELLAKAEDRLHGRLRRLSKDLREMKSADAEMIEL